MKGQAIDIEPVNANNTLGALIFISYILLALFLTATVCRSLIDTFLTLPPSSRSSPNLSRNLNIFTALATLSFSVLSYHMLDVLLVSYESWAQNRHIPLPSRFYGLNGIIGAKGAETTPLHLWTWARTSTLFTDFAKAISWPYERAVWSGLELFTTLSWNTIFVFEGPRRKIEHLWAYVLLSQVLPASFAQNLFCLACLMQTRVKPGAQIWRPNPVWFQLPVFVHASLILLSPSLVDSGYLLPAIGVIRLLTLWPFVATRFAPRTVGKEVPVDEVRREKLALLKLKGMPAMAVVSLHIYLAVRNGAGAGRLMDAINDEPAVSALGYDWLISIVSAALWHALVDDSPVLIKAEEKTSA